MSWVVDEAICVCLQLVDEERINYKLSIETLCIYCILHLHADHILEEEVLSLKCNKCENFKIQFKICIYYYYFLK